MRERGRTTVATSNRKNYQVLGLFSFIYQNKQFYDILNVVLLFVFLFFIKFYNFNFIIIFFSLLAHSRFSTKINLISRWLVLHFYAIFPAFIGRSGQRLALWWRFLGYKIEIIRSFHLCHQIKLVLF